MPIALDDVLRAGRITPAASAVYLQAMLGDVLRAGKNESVFREVVRAVLTLGGEPTDWQGLAQRVSVGSRNTVKDYLDVMARCFLLVVLDQPRALGATTPAPRKARKLHVPDPFFHHVLTAWAQGHPDADTIASRTLGDPSARGRLVESAVAGHLAPRFAQTLFWRGRSEIDLIGVHASGEQLRVEVKYRARITSTDRRPLERSGGGLLLTRDTLAWEPAVALVPVPLLLLSLPAV